LKLGKNDYITLSLVMVMMLSISVFFQASLNLMLTLGFALLFPAVILGSLFSRLYPAETRR